jgi:tRNA 2-thiouridine synthesizing protein A
MVDLKSGTPAETLDVQGRVCPYPIVSIKKGMEKLPSGAVLKILSDSTEAVDDSIPRYCEKHGYKLEAVKIEGKGYWEIYIQKT